MKLKKSTYMIIALLAFFIIISFLAPVIFFHLEG